ncbi:hypothetical protein HHK36_013094 [Tetracentron sinense]|uniref:Uncharacterized protein n=1 Tax=Tetracentron sinense TaxID=13715 RepID=A0A834ZGG5_TETSI|nr:hypothetical protein HHK36_013094 [Tetracentron sinense]
MAESGLICLETRGETLLPQTHFLNSRGEDLASPTKGFWLPLTGKQCNNFVQWCDENVDPVSSVVQVVEIILCLYAAAKISHRAQSIAAVATKWHALVTCIFPNASLLRVSSSVGNLEAAYPVGSLSIGYSESDLESLDYVAHLASYMSSYQETSLWWLFWTGKLLQPLAELLVASLELRWSSLLAEMERWKETKGTLVAGELEALLLLGKIETTAAPSTTRVPRGHCSCCVGRTKEEEG